MKQLWQITVVVVGLIIGCQGALSNHREGRGLVEYLLIPEKLNLYLCPASPIVISIDHKDHKICVKICINFKNLHQY